MKSKKIKSITPSQTGGGLLQTPSKHVAVLRPINKMNHIEM